MAPTAKQIEDTTTVEIPKTSVSAAQTTNIEVSASPILEYINNEPWGAGSLIHGLPPQIDELERDFGLDIYDRMELEPIINSQLGILVSAAFAEEPEIVPAVSPEEPEYEDAM